MAKQVVTLMTSEYFSDFLNSARNTNTRTVYKITKADEVKNDLLTSIQSNDQNSIEKVLKQYFIYSAGEKLTSEYTGHYHRKEWEFQEFIARPMLEALFFEHIEYFHDVLSAVIQSENNQIKELFKKSCLDMKNDIPKHLLTPFNESQKEKLASEINALAAENDKNQIAKVLATKLKTSLELIPDNASELEIAEHKLQLIKMLHEQDKILAKEPNYRKILVNIATIILSGCIINLFNLALTGQFLLFNKTPAQQRVANIDKLIDQSIYSELKLK